MKEKRIYTKKFYLGLIVRVRSKLLQGLRTTVHGHKRGAGKGDLWGEAEKRCRGIGLFRSFIDNRCSMPREERHVRRRVPAWGNV